MLNITSAMQFPTSMVLMYDEEFFTKKDRIWEGKIFLFLKSAILSLLEVRKAISRPEKKAESTNAIRTMAQGCVIYEIKNLIPAFAKAASRRQTNIRIENGSNRVECPKIILPFQRINGCEYQRVFFLPH